MKFKLLMESQLLEDIAAVRKNYPKISDKDFDRIIRLDPTFKEGRDSVGTYGKWLLSLFNKGKLTNEGHAYDLLSRFEEEKKNLKNKDIGKFKSLEEVDEYLNDDDNYKTLSHRQEVRARQKDRKNADLGNEAELVYEDSDWEVWVPKTYAASCKLGQGSSWCTASTESDYYYKYYTRQGYLYININKSDPEEKYQFHFESGSFMDIDDSDIDIYPFLEDYPNLREFYLPKLLSAIGVDVDDVGLDGFVRTEVTDFKEAFGENGKLLESVMSGDIYEVFDFSFYWNDFELSYVDRIRYFPDSVKELLSQLGINSDEELAEVEEEDGDVMDAFRRAYILAKEVGTQDEVYDDFVRELNNCGAEIKDGKIYAYLSVKELLTSEYYGDANHYSEIVIYELSNNFNLVEPRYGWDGFNEDIFYERLEDELYDIVRSR